MNWKDGRTELEIDGFNVVVYQETDEYADLEHLGKYSMKDPGGYVIDRRQGLMFGPAEEFTKKFDSFDEQCDWMRNQRDYHKLHLYDEITDGSSVVTLFTHRPVLRDVRRGTFRYNDFHYFLLSEVAYGEKDYEHEDFPKWFEQDYNRFEDYCKMHWEMIGLVAKAFYKSVHLGTASLWGIESDSGDEFIDSTARELAQEAVREAKEKLEELREV